jgi:hypothetical protein
MQPAALAARNIGVMQQAALAESIIYKCFINPKTSGVNECSNICGFIKIDWKLVVCSLKHLAPRNIGVVQHWLSACFTSICMLP